MKLIGRTIDHSGAEAINGSEGKNLLSALTAFVKAVVDSRPENHSEQGEVLQISKYASKYLKCGLLLEGPSKPGVAVDEDIISEVPRDLPTGESHTTHLSNLVLICFPSNKMQKSHGAN